MPPRYFLSPTALRHIGEHKAWSIAKFGHKQTDKYFQDLAKGVEYIADKFQGLAERHELTGETGFCIYPVREHYVLFVPLENTIFIAAIISQRQDVPGVLDEYAPRFRREMQQFVSPSKPQKPKPRTRKKP